MKAKLLPSLSIFLVLWNAATGRAQVILPTSDPSDDPARNWTIERTFDADGNVVAETKDFADGLGRPTQSQVKNQTNHQVLAQQTIYSSLGTPALSTLAAPINNQAFKYKENFVTVGGTPYGPLNFEGTKANNPDPVDAATMPGTLGYYYSTENAQEPYTPITSYPYSLVEPFTDPIGGIKRTAAPGDALRMGTGRESSQRTLPLLNDLTHYAAAQSQFINASATSYIHQGFKTVAIDVGGRETVTFTSKEGWMLATCLSGAQYPATNLMGWVDSDPANWQGNPAYQDIHVSAGTQQLMFTAGGTVRIINLKTGAVVVDNFPITASASIGTAAPALVPGFYRIVSLTGAQWFTYDVHYGDFAYTYYNDAGQPVAQVAPKGINLASNGSLSFVTRTIYSSTGLPLTRQSDDEGLTEYVYAQDGRIRFSQNARQRLAGSFSYVNYDKLNRVVEWGEFLLGGSSPLVFENQLTATPQTNSVLQPALLEARTRDQPLLTPGQRSQVSSAWYDSPFQDTELGGRQQEFLLGNVAKTQNAQGITWYSYDEMGRLTWTVQSLTDVGTKTVDYKYDISGKVLEIAYQKNQSDAFYHQYEYDADGRLSNVYTSPDSFTRTLQATYIYYLHGPLKRLELANRLQGVDYLYTLAGSLKSINHVNQALDPGHDSPAANGVPKDLFGLTLDYYSGDYQSAALPTAITPTLDPVGGQPRPVRYDGMLSDAAWRTASSPDYHQMVYSYNAKDQLTQSDYGKLTIKAGAYQFVPDALHALEEGNLDYDANGNITTLRRRNKEGMAVDDFTYDYTTTDNRLAAVHAPGSSAADPTGLEYDYNATGQITHQRSGQEHRYLQYDVAGQVTDIFRDAARQQHLVSFAYDDRGFRCRKTAYNAAGAESLRTYYVRDAQGNILANYEQNLLGSQPLQRSEIPLYGAGRVGTITHINDGTVAGRDDARYELNDQRGDARVVFHQPTTTNETETMELSGVPARASFQGADTYRYNSREAHSGDYVALMDGRAGTPPMLIRSISVQKGDTITFSAWAKISGGFGQPNLIANPGVSRAQPFLLLGAAAGTPAHQAASEPARSQPGVAGWLGRAALGISFALPGKSPAAPARLAGSLGNPVDTFNAWIRYQVRDENDHPVGDEQTVYLPDDAHTNWKSLQLGVRVQQAGSIELIASSAETSTYVLFDDLTVEYTGGMIVQEQHQYAYGAPLPGLSYVTGGKIYRHGYQGQFAEKDQETGWDNFEYRNYDSRIGRWLSPDAIRRVDSPYTGMGNNPMAFGDPDGKDVIVLNNTSGAGGAGHVALLVQNRKTGGWDLYSKNGTNWLFGYSGPAPAEGHAANQYGTGKDSYASLDDFFAKNAKEYSVKYDRAVLIKTTALEDGVARERAVAVLGAPYHLLDSSCQTMVQEALSDLGIGGVFGGSGMSGQNTPNANFDILLNRLKANNNISPFNPLHLVLGTPRPFVDISGVVSQGIAAAISGLRRAPTVLPRFKIGVHHM